MGNRDSEGEPKIEERSDAEADDVTQLFRKPEKDERLKNWSGQVPDVPAPQFKRPEDPALAKKNAGSGRGVMASLESAGDTRKTAIASSVGVILVASLMVGAGIGWVIDKFILHDPPTPWGMVCGLLLGVVVGFYNVARIAAKLQDDDGNA